MVSVCLFALSVWAQAGIRSYGSADFVRLHSWDDLQDGDLMLIGAQYVREGGFYLMTSTALKKKMQAERVCDEAPAKLSCEDETMVWRYRKGGNGMFALESLAGKFLGEVDKTNVMLTTNQAFVWNVETTDGSTYRFRHKSTPDRYIGFSYYPPAGGKSASYFGNYLPGQSDSEDLILFRQMRADEYHGTATMPENGVRVTLYAEEYAAKGGSSTGVLQSFKADSCKLHSGLLAPGSEMLVWECRHGDSGNTFSLQYPDGTYLDGALQRSGTAFEWCISDGYISPAAMPDAGEAGENTERRIYFSRDKRHFCLLTADEALSQGAPAVGFKAVGKSPFSEYDAATRKKTLTGAWPANLLRTIGWDGVASLDLTMAELPLLATDFAYRPKKSNAPIYVKAGMEETVPASWTFVVAKGGDGEPTLLRKTVMADKQPFLPTYTFSAEDGMLLYEREAFTDGYWETVCLPFSSPVPKDFQAEVLSEIREGELVFSPTEHLEAYVPAIVRYVGNKTGGTALLSCHAEAGLVEKPRFAPTFTGVFDTLQVADAAEAVYLLEESGQKFVRAAAGSRLMPFRAYIRQTEDTAGGTQTLTVLHAADIEAGIDRVGTMPDNECRRACYDLRGRKVADPMSEEIWETLRPGIYIVGGKKVIKHK